MKTRATAVVVHENKILLIHRIKTAEEYWVLPGGAVEAGESLEEAVLRELREETTIQAEIGQKLFEMTDSNGDRHVLYSCKYISGEPKLDPESEEALNSDSTQSYSPQWREIKEISKLTIKSQETKEFLLKTYSNNKD